MVEEHRFELHGPNYMWIFFSNKFRWLSISMGFISIESTNGWSKHHISTRYWKFMNAEGQLHALFL